MFQMLRDHEGIRYGGGGVDAAVPSDGIPIHRLRYTAEMNNPM